MTGDQISERVQKVKELLDFVGSDFGSGASAGICAGLIGVGAMLGSFAMSAFGLVGMVCALANYSVRRASTRG
ncbi:hypothetical protein [Paraburkholderia fungorum]|uniref:hypothetical protein n=1 Tax=Paraburkholderia fungorum TaxID=134537 RepID=UPI000FDA1893|nr:hypothetical protein [Paraburkholderia fungorum]MBB5546646.1 hypothetical protein [Paraburkholderia fungorum]